MTVIRKLQWNKNLHSYFIVIPKQIVEGMEMEKGKPFRFSIKGEKLVMSPHLNNPKDIASGDQKSSLSSGYEKEQESLEVLHEDDPEE